MRISSFRLENYKSFVDSGEISFSSGFNVIIGQNNVGKTALLEALGLNFVGKPHRSLLTIPNPNVGNRLPSTATLTLGLSGEELRKILFNFSKFSLPVPNDPDQSTPQHAQAILEKLWGSDEVKFTSGLVAENNGKVNLKNVRFPSLQMYEGRLHGGGKHKLFFTVVPDFKNNEFGVEEVHTAGGEDQDFGLSVSNVLRDRIYSFRSERLNVGVHAVGPIKVLAPNAANLAQVLNNLQSNPYRFAHFNELVREIFPSVLQVSVKQISDSLAEIFVWNEDPRTEREDLAIELKESGTGVGQVLAMLYVVLTSEYPRTIIIDEPNSFLHPGAARKLIEILKGFPQHQYIVSTHSPEILKAADPDFYTLIKWDKPQSKIEQLDPKNFKDAKKCLVEVGAKLSDVFGADNILWVEGETEEQCFPLILQGKYPRFGTNIVRIRNTGELEAKRGLAEKIWDIYRRLSTGYSLIPPAISFVLDQEGRTSQQLEKLISISDGLVQFLPRRTYENYLLNPSALLAVTMELSNFYETPIAEGDISKWFAENGGKAKYLDPTQTTVDPSNKEWLKKVHGAKLLIDYFQEFSQGRYSYIKTDHSFELTKWLINNDRKALDELEGFLIRIFEKGEKLN